MQQRSSSCWKKRRSDLIFDSAVGGAGPHPLAGFGAGFGKVKPNEPVLVDVVHVHRGYVVDATRMFSKGKLENHWLEKLDDMTKFVTRYYRVLEKEMIVAKYGKMDFL